jgi:apolipoprotein N-acyltransferase
MEDALAVTNQPAANSWLLKAISRVRADSPTLVEWLASLGTAILLTLSFPNFDLFLLAWIGLVPVLIVVARRPAPIRAFMLGWVSGSVFFYCSCYWLTHSMIHYGGLPAPLAYVLLVPGALVVGLFPGLFALLVSVLVRRWGNGGLVAAPFIWPACEWFRLGVSGQLWNALGYSQAYYPLLIQGASWGGVYAISFLITAVNVALTLLFLLKSWKSLALSISILLVVLIVIGTSTVQTTRSLTSESRGFLNVVAVQPNVPMTLVKSATETQELLDRHLSISTDGLQSFNNDPLPRLVIWPESPMNFTYGSDRTLQNLIGKFASENRTSVLLNSLERAQGDGAYNSAVLINEEGRQIAQYDKIRLMPFGEYVPLPHWLGGSLISGIVGDFTPGKRYALMPVANHQSAVFICIESAYPSIARMLTKEGAEVLINISNDGYLGPTAVMRQHLANTVFRAVENGRPLLRVTNTGITAYISATGSVSGATEGFTPTVRTWVLTDWKRNTFYTRYGDLFVQLCALVTIVTVLTALFQKRRIKNLR